MTARSSLVPALGTVRRLRALVALGWPPAVLRARSGLAVELLVHAVDGVLVTEETAARAVALFERLSPMPGPDLAVRAMAAALKWLPPLAWDDDELDNPAARGNRGVHRPHRRAA